MPKRIKSSDKFICMVCNRLFSERAEATLCEEGHKIIYVPFERKDLRRLIDFVVTGNPDYLTEHLINTLMQYNRINL